MIAYSSAAVINFGDFGRFSRTDTEMRKGNLLGRINFRLAGYVTTAIGFFVGALRVSVIGNAGLPAFVDTLGALIGGACRS